MQSPHISWGSVAVCLAQFVSQSGPLVYCTPFLICSASPNASDQCVIHRSIITYCMWMSWEMSPLPLFPWRSLYWKSYGHRQIEVVCFGVGGVRWELLGPLTWMNCWRNVEAGNSWIVYINMINIALINHISVIYCGFSHLAPNGKLWRISQWSVHFLYTESSGSSVVT